MPDIGVNIAILQEEKMLLTQREDFEVWCLPGGSVKEGESLPEAARREAREETGLEIELTRMVGLYSRPNWHEGGTHAVVFAARPVGGAWQPNPVEVLQMRYFGAGELPEPLLFGHRQRILDALSGACGAVWVQPAYWPLPMDITREEMYARRDASGLGRRQYYLAQFGQDDGDQDFLAAPPLYTRAGSGR